MNHVTSSGAIDDRQPDEAALTPSDDVLDAEVVDRIEELHNAVMADGERRSMWGKRTALPTVAEAAEEAYLAAQGFASYGSWLPPRSCRSKSGMPVSRPPWSSERTRTRPSILRPPSMSMSTTALPAERVDAAV